MDSDLQNDSGTVCKIIFVDYEANIREIDPFLNSLGRPYEVIGLTNGESLFEYLHNTAESLLPNVIVLDRLTGEMSAFDTLQQLKNDARFSQIPVIIHSSILPDRLKNELLKDGAEEMRQKESVLDALKQFVSRFIHQE